MSRYQCPTCGSNKITVFHEPGAVPANSCILLKSEAEAINCPKGHISLGFCSDCSFIYNTAFDPVQTEYSERYEGTQSFSPSFGSFQAALAKKMIGRHRLYKKNIVEIGCGRGEFLALLCELGGNSGVGFDPSFDPRFDNPKTPVEITFITDFFSEKYSYIHPDIIICKMTLEHIPNPHDFLSMIRRSIGDKPSTIVFFMVPDATRIMRDCAFEDIYYEHCSYFTPGSLSHLFEKCGFELMDLENTYEDQYISLEARPCEERSHLIGRHKADLSELNKWIERFRQRYGKKRSCWRNKLDRIFSAGSRTVIWGSGSKGVTFLNSLNDVAGIDCVVDINPHKQGYYMAGTGQKIIGPNDLVHYEPDVIIVMNSIYCDEISHDLNRLGISAEIITLDVCDLEGI